VTNGVPRANYSGLLLRLKSERSFPLVADSLGDVHHRGLISAHGWHLYEWASEFDAGVDARGVSDTDGRFVYPLLLREVEERFLLASTHSDVVQQFVTRNRLARLIERPMIDVAGLVRESVFPATEDSASGASPYKMGALYASVDGFGRSVRTISLFGDDLASAGVVRDVLKYLNPFRVALRDVRSEQEVLSISTQGEINFYYRGAASLEGVDKALAYVRRGNFIHWRSKQ
jgi:hypothetical protein